ncbi:MAG: rRNA maturation RNase YbeY [Microcoleaceae cyanobacterium]
MQLLQVEVTVQGQFQGDCLDDFQDISQEPITPSEWQQWFQQWLTLQQADLMPALAYEVSLCLTDDPTIQALNAQYRQQDQPTDVLAFAILEAKGQWLQEALQSQPLDLGDIVISVETAAQQAQRQGHPLRTELAWLATHGLLHLLGWDHPDQNCLNQMLEQQRLLIQAVGLWVPSTYTD